MTDNQLDAIDKSTAGNLSEKVAESILRSAIEGRLKMGQRLTEVELAREMGVSRVPVREALRALEARGVVETNHRETRLFEGNIVALRELIEARKLVQLAVLPEAIIRVQENPELLYGFEDALDLVRRHFRRGDPYELSMAVLEFHRQLFVAAGNRTLQAMFDLIAPRMMIALGLTLFETPENRIIGEHEKFLSMIRKGETQAALDFLPDLIDEGLLTPHGGKTAAP
ncbi:GntR family transcriptional regulator [Mesobacterium pallidum]|uniref:GntR family transcriptional regulator n=1 Tax=Mesobacterium pallidum TaxID=2872037 RepID=UPI001EE37778